MKYLYLDKPAYDPETETILPDYKIEDGTFISGWQVDKKPDDDGYVPTPEEQPSGAITLGDRVTDLEEALELILEGATT